MRKILFLTGIAILFFTSCERHEVPDPFADFGVEYSLVEPNEVIFFNNYSTDADRYEWDFGDGTISYDFQPSHYYQSEGVFRVKLAAYRGNKVDFAYITIDVYETTLEVEVIEYETGIYVPNVRVTLYPSFMDWENFTNAIVFGYTDLDGIVVFKGVETMEYFIDAWNESFNNEVIAYDDVNFIKTTQLQYAMHNVFTAYVDFSPSGKIELRSASIRVKPTNKSTARVAKDLNRIKEK